MIKVDNLSKTYTMKDGAQIDALKNINLTINKGEIVGIIGMSGSGKSTLLRILRALNILSKVLFPEPLIPMMPTISPLLIVKLMFFNASI